MSDEIIITDEEIKKFNEKVDRFEQRGYKYVPEKISRKDIEGMSNNELEVLRDNVDEFLRNDAIRVDNKSGVSRYFKRYYNKEFEKLEGKKAELRSEVSEDTSKGTMGAINKLNLKARTNRFNAMTEKQKIRSLIGIESQLKKNPEEYKRNYIEALKTNFGEGSVEYDLIKEVVDKIDAKKLYLLYGENADLQIDFIYTVGDDISERAQTILDAFKDEGYITDKMDVTAELVSRLKDIWL